MEQLREARREVELANESLRSQQRQHQEETSLLSARFKEWELEKEAKRQAAIMDQAINKTLLQLMPIADLGGGSGSPDSRIPMEDGSVLGVTSPGASPLHPTPAHHPSGTSGASPRDS